MICKHDPKRITRNLDSVLPNNYQSITKISNYSSVNYFHISQIFRPPRCEERRITLVGRRVVFYCLLVWANFPLTQKMKYDKCYYSGLRITNTWWNNKSRFYNKVKEWKRLGKWREVWTRYILEGATQYNGLAFVALLFYMPFSAAWRVVEGVFP